MQEASGILCSPLLSAAHIQMANLLSASNLTDKRKRQENSTRGCLCAHPSATASFNRRPKNQQDTHLIAVLLNASVVEGRCKSSLKADEPERHLKNEA